MKEVPKKEESSVAGGVASPPLPSPGTTTQPNPITGVPAIPPVPCFPDYLINQPK